MTSDAPENKDINASQATRWYLASSKPRQELRAIENLENQGITAFTPVMQVEKVRQGKKRVEDEVMFTGYIFIQISPEDGLWHKVRSTRGIRDWVRFSGQAATVPEALVTSFIALQESEESPSVRPAFNPGDAVTIKSGPFEGLKGIYQAANGEQRSMILIEFLGKQNRVKMENDQFTLD